jgi:hypothetical protein
MFRASGGWQFLDSLLLVARDLYRANNWRLGFLPKAATLLLQRFRVSDRSYIFAGMTRGVG